MINVSQGGWVADSTFRTLPSGSMLAIHATDTNLTSHHLDTMRLAITWCRNVLGCSTEDFHAVSSHETVKRTEHIRIFRKSQ
jgi:hypothetical protein